MHYNTIRYYKRTAELKRLLGDKCGACGSSGKLQFHHVDPREKSFDLSSEFAKPWGQLLVELKKCVLRCRPCHLKEHAAKHGIGMYTRHKCRCDICRTSWNAYCNKNKKAARARKKAALSSVPEVRPCKPGAEVGFLQAAPFAPEAL